VIDSERQFGPRVPRGVSGVTRPQVLQTACDVRSFGSRSDMASRIAGVVSIMPVAGPVATMLAFVEASDAVTSSLAPVTDDQGMSELECVPETALCLREISEGRWPR
jgi:hypothetical protein